jgi:transposase
LLPQNVSLSELPLIADGETSMRNGKRGRYTLEFKQEAVRLVDSGQSVAEAARSLGVVEQTLANWVKAKRARKLKEVSDKTGVTAEQVEISRLRAELARVTMERDILEKATAYFARGQK